MEIRKAMFFQSPFKKTKYAMTFLIIVLVAFFLWLQPEKAADETLFSGGTILTMDPTRPTADALLMRGPKIIAIGTKAKVLAEAETSPDIIDLNGNTLMPGLIEPHTHALTTAMFDAMIDVSGFEFTNRTEVVAALKSGINDITGSGWALAFGWDPVMLSDLEAPTLAELDNWSPDRPLIILTQMMHDAYANSAALKAAGITAETPNPLGGEFVRGSDGKLTGTIRENSAIAQLYAATPRPPAGAADLLLSLKYNDYARAGYTTVATVGPVSPMPDPIGVLKRVAPTAPVKSMIYALPHQVSKDQTPESGDIDAAVIGVKFWMDGSPFAGGAAFKDGYEDSQLVRDQLHLKPGHMPDLNYTEDDFKTRFAEFHNRGFQIATHVQGELAVDRALDMIERVLVKHPRNDHRHRLEHNALITKSQLARAAALGVTTSFFVDHVNFYGHALKDIIGNTRLTRYMPLKSAINAGHKVTVHTDNPATPIGALRAMHTLRARTSRLGGEVVGPEEKLTPQEALEAMTINAAWQLGVDHETGSLATGKDADLLLLSGNPLETPDKDLQALQVLKTWVKGQPADTRNLTPTTLKQGVNTLWHMLVGN
jgi:predicted amidohydrolase YtcJ